MANFRKRNNGWQAQIRKKGLPSITKTFTQRKDALAWANTIESEIDRGIYIDRSLVEVTLLADVFDRIAKEIIPGLKGAKSEHSSHAPLLTTVMLLRIQYSIHNSPMLCKKR